MPQQSSLWIGDLAFSDLLDLEGKAVGRGIMAVGSIPRIIRMGLAIAALSLSLSACGSRGSLEPPPGAKAAGAARSAEAHDPGPNSEAPRKRHEDFILDPLLR